MNENPLFKKFADADPILRSVQEQADQKGLGTNTKMHYGDFLTILYAAMRRSFEAGAGRFKPLFDQNARLTPDGQALHGAIDQALRFCTYDWVNEGYSPREVGHLVQMAAVDIELEGVLNLKSVPDEKSQAAPEPTRDVEKNPAL